MHNVRIAEIGKGAGGEFFQMATTIFGLDHAAQRLVDGGLLGPRTKDDGGPINQFLIQLDLSGGHCSPLSMDLFQQCYCTFGPSESIRWVDAA